MTHSPPEVYKICRQCQQFNAQMQAILNAADGQSPDWDAWTALFDEREELRRQLNCTQGPTPDGPPLRCGSNAFEIPPGR